MKNKMEGTFFPCKSIFQGEETKKWNKQTTATVKNISKQERNGVIWAAIQRTSKQCSDAPFNFLYCTLSIWGANLSSYLWCLALGKLIDSLLSWKSPGQREEKFLKQTHLQNPFLILPFSPKLSLPLNYTRANNNLHFI